MLQDKALRKTLKKPAANLPYGFSNRVMRQICLRMERKSRRNYIAGIVAAGITSCILFISSLLILHRYFSINLAKTFQKIGSVNFNDPFIQYLAFFFLIVLFLLTMDLSLRQFVNKKV